MGLSRGKVMYKVLISDAMSNVADQIFNDKGIEVDVITGLSEQELINIIPEYDGLLVRSATTVTADILAAATKLKAIARAGAGVDNIDCAKARENGVVVMNTPGGNTNATAEHAFALIMAALRKIPFADETTHKGEWQKKAIKGVELSKKTLGIVGFGNIGARLSHLVSGFDVNVLVCSKSLESRQAEFPHVTNVSFDELLAQSDIISFHGKAAADGKPLVNKEHLAKMKSSAIIINAARGNMVDESDLNDALNEGLIAGAAIDVFSTEPAKENVLFNNPKAILTPHLGASTAEASIVVAEMAANQVADVLQNNVEIHVVN
jgi:D-3-phosphoglycerate dehydrogenase / 2-oxoglutarate reductase